MSRLQKKCFLGSVTMHCALLTILVVGPAFLAGKPVPISDLPVLELIPPRLIDEAFMSGGSPRAAAPQPAPPAEPAVSPPPAASKPTAQKTVQPPTPKPERTEARDESWTAPDKKSAKKPPPNDATTDRKDNPKSSKGKPKINLTPAVRNAADPPPNTTRTRGAEGGRGTAEARQATLAGVMSELRGGLSEATDIGIVGGGGEANANYWQALKTINTDAWNPPDDLTDSGKVKAEITIARNGRVVSAKITPSGKSGIPSLDRSVQDVLERVKDVPPFPEESKDTERTFKLLFDQKLKRLIG